MNRLILGLAAFATLATAMPLFTTVASAQSVYQREDNQDRRIDQGVRSGALTERETHHLERREDRLHNREDRMRARNSGRLSYSQGLALKRQENRISGAIHRKKHNDRGY